MKGRTTSMAHVHIPGSGDPWLLLQHSAPGSAPGKGTRMENPIFVQMSLECRGREGAAPSAEALPGQALPPCSWSILRCLLQAVLLSSIPSTLLFHFVPIRVPEGVQDTSSHKQCCFPHVLCKHGWCSASPVDSLTQGHFLLLTAAQNLQFLWIFAFSRKLN